MDEISMVINKSNRDKLVDKMTSEYDIIHEWWRIWRYIIIFRKKNKIIVNNI